VSIPTQTQLTRWRRLLLVRDSRATSPGDDAPRAGVCAICGDGVHHRLAHLQAHHIRPMALYPELALRLDNGVMICAGHHQGVVHNHNAALDVRPGSHDLYRGWGLWVSHLSRWNRLAQNRRYNEENQWRVINKR
jgi:5-methylcytosine-specific restriction endonuclease McrA